ncbi:hypothetical protein EDC63_101142 [Sulfurirhabdus autotrophica]|uniref:Uncharacterized protein n=1 Tax=Sulfurirhabdus autotrophica TaxID=1706046 RepID=A0A4R3YCJ5_9PROT|nr:hypothetical protein EDC63_101142 [Sulfurirhabdus autotrophica]
MYFMVLFRVSFSTVPYIGLVKGLKDEIAHLPKVQGAR